MLIHVVTPGETLWEIASRYGVDFARLVAVNKLPDAGRLVIGQALIIPSAARQHTVESGETLWKIAQQYGVSVDSLMQANQLTDSLVINRGKVLYIPARTHTVQPGESLGQIAQNYGTTVQDIIEANSIQNLNQVYSGTSLIIPFSKAIIDVYTYVINMGEKGADEVREAGDSLTCMSPFSYVVRSDGELQPLDDQAIIQAARFKGVLPVMCITNFTYGDPGSDAAQTILASTELQDKLLENIVATIEQKRYRGLNINFENLYPTDRENYNQFLQRAVNRLHEDGYFVSTAVAPKTSAEQTGFLYEAHDYAAHGRIVDIVFLMMYEWGYRLGPPQAISPLNQMRSVLEYAVTVIPRNKILMGFQLYARDWLLPHVQGQEAETFDMQEAVQRAAKYKTTIQYDEIAQSPFYQYVDEQGKRHEVWFEDARSAQSQFNLVKEYGIRGIGYWVTGYPFPQNWVLLNDQFRVRKRS